MAKLPILPNLYLLLKYLKVKHNILPYSTLSSPPLSISPCKFGKLLIVRNFIEQNFKLKALILEITSRKIFLIILFMWYHITIIQLLFLKILLISLLLQALNEVYNSYIFLVFFLYTWSSKVNSIFITSGQAFCLINSISIGSFSFSFSPSYSYYIWLKLLQLEDQLPNF